MGMQLRIQTPDRASSLIDELTLCRIAGERGVTRSELRRDLGALLAHRLSPSEIRSQIDEALTRLSVAVFTSECRGRLSLTSAGEKRVCTFLGCKSVPSEWTAVRDVRLVAYALGLAGESEQRIKSLARPDGLRAAILQQVYRLPGKRVPSAAKLRCALAVVALERAFGNKVKSGLESGKGLSAKAGRLLAGQLARRPREFGTDTRLIAALAAEACGALQLNAISLRAAVLKNAISRDLGISRPLDVKQASLAPSKPVPAVENITEPVVIANRPDLPGFAAIVRRIAERCGEGWPGNKKGFICSIWREIQSAYRQWGLTEIEFKAMLVEAHRTGHLILANADLKSKSNAEDIQASAVSYKNTVWHYVRAEI